MGEKKTMEIKIEELRKLRTIKVKTLYMGDMMMTEEEARHYVWRVCSRINESVLLKSRIALIRESVPIKVILIKGSRK